MKNALAVVVFVLEAIERIHAYRSKPPIDPVDAIKTEQAIIRELEILCDATASLPHEVKNRFKQIPWQKIKDFRNVLAHDYFDIHQPNIEQVIIEHLPPLQTALQQIWQELGKPELKPWSAL